MLPLSRLNFTKRSFVLILWLSLSLSVCSICHSPEGAVGGKAEDEEGSTSEDEEEEEDLIGHKGKAPNALLMEV